MVHRYAWFDPTISQWCVGEKEELNYNRYHLKIPVTNIESKWCATKPASVKFQNSILNRNKKHIS